MTKGKEKGKAEEPHSSQVAMMCFSTNTPTQCYRRTLVIVLLTVKWWYYVSYVCDGG